MDTIYETYAEHVAKSARKFSRGNADTAADIEQDTWLAIIAHHAKHEVTRAIVSVLAHRCGVEYYRQLSKVGAQVATTDDGTTIDHSDPAPSDTLSVDLRLDLESLADSETLEILRRKLRGDSQRDIVESSGRCNRTIAKAQYRIAEIVARYLERVDLLT